MADSGNHRIVVIENGMSSVVAGGVKNRADKNEFNGGSYRNGSLDMAGFSNPQGVLADASGVYVADTGNGAVRKITDGLVTTIGTVLSPRGMVLIDGKLYVCDSNSNFVTTFADSKRVPAYTDINPTSKWYTAAAEMYEHGIFIGVTDSYFEPNSVMTRAQYIMALGNLHTFLFPDALIAGESEPFPTYRQTHTMLKLCIGDAPPELPTEPVKIYSALT